MEQEKQHVKARFEAWNKQKWTSDTIVDLPMSVFHFALENPTLLSVHNADALKTFIIQHGKEYRLPQDVEIPE